MFCFKKLIQQIRSTLVFRVSALPSFLNTFSVTQTHDWSLRSEVYLRGKRFILFNNKNRYRIICERKWTVLLFLVVSAQAHHLTFVIYIQTPFFPLQTCVSWMRCRCFCTYFPPAVHHVCSPKQKKKHTICTSITHPVWDRQRHKMAARCAAFLLLNDCYLSTESFFLYASKIQNLQRCHRIGRHCHLCRPTPRMFVIYTWILFL